MAIREIIRIVEEKCTGCGLCIPNCPEGAIQIIDKKARLISDLFCDGLGACIGHCPEDAIIIEKREAEKYDERRVMENIIKQGKNVIVAHLDHLRDHKQTQYLKEAEEFLKEKNITIKSGKGKNMSGFQCPSSKTMEFGEKKDSPTDESGKRASQLRQWPLQLHLVSPAAPYFQSADVILAADCVAFAVGDFHKNFLKGKSIAIACPKLDDSQDIYLEKLQALMEDSKINTLTVMIMEVPCCHGLLNMAKQALENSKRKVPIKSVVVGIDGDIRSDEWV